MPGRPRVKSKKALFKSLPQQVGADERDIMELAAATMSSEEPQEKTKEGLKAWIRKPWMAGGGVDWQRVESLYVRNPQPVSLARLATMLDLSPATVREHAYRRDWEARRLEFHRQFGQRVIQRLADDQAAYVRAGLQWYREWALRARNALVVAMASLEIRTMREAMEVLDRVMAIDKALGVLSEETAAKINAIEGEVIDYSEQMDYQATIDRLDEIRGKLVQELEASRKYHPDALPPATLSELNEPFEPAEPALVEAEKADSD